MATAVVERPLSALIDTPVSPQRRPRASSVVEVIDVDSVDEPINVSSRPAARSQGGSLVPSPDVISVSDSDDDDFLLAQPVATRSNHDRSRQPTGLYSHYAHGSTNKLKIPLNQVKGIACFLPHHLHQTEAYRMSHAYLGDILDSHRFP